MVYEMSNNFFIRLGCALTYGNGFNETVRGVYIQDFLEYYPPRAPNPS